MRDNNNFTDINRQWWNKVTGIHTRSEFYDMEGFLKGRNSLNDIELKLLGDLKDKKILHLQCHFGQDTLSMARMGADVTGIDLSDNAIRFARDLATKTGQQARFICCDIHELPEHLNEVFDIVFTSYGAIDWLPDLVPWADIIARFLSRGGQFIMAEFHPMIYLFDENFEKIQNNYFSSDPIISTSGSTYTDGETFVNQQSVSWNHTIAEVITSLIACGLELTSFEEFDYSPYGCFNNNIESEPGKFIIPGLESKIPMVFALKAIKK